MNNIFLIILDCVRADFMYNPKVAPYINNNEEFIKLPRVISTATWTPPSVASILTGKYPSQHGVHESENRYRVVDLGVWGAIGKRVVLRKTLNNVMRRLGYNTLLISHNPWLPIITRDKYISYDILHKVAFNIDVHGDIVARKNRLYVVFKYHLYKQMLNLFKYMMIKNYPKDKGARFTLNLIKEFPLKEPLYSFMFLIDTHESYDIKGIISRKYRYSVKGYVRSIKYVDKQLHKMFKTLEGKIDYDNTLIIVTADHGQLFGEYGRYGHGGVPVKELVHVPLFIKLPKYTKILSKPRGYFSLSKIPKLIAQVINNKFDPEELYEPYVYTESFVNRYVLARSDKLFDDNTISL